MDSTRKRVLLVRQLNDDLIGLNPSTIIRWLDEQPNVYFFNIHDLVGGILGLGNSAEEQIECIGDDSDEDDWLEAMHVWHSGEDNQTDLDFKIEGSELVIVDDDTRDEVMRSTLPDWLLELDALIKFQTRIFQRPLTASELRDYLLSIWLPWLT